MLLIVCGDIESSPGPGSDRRVRVLDLIFVVVMPIWTSWLCLERIIMMLSEEEGKKSRVYRKKKQRKEARREEFIERRNRGRRQAEKS